MPQNYGQIGQNERKIEKKLIICIFWPKKKHKKLLSLVLGIIYIMVSFYQYYYLMSLGILTKY